ncbi:GDSL esterase/lipase At4g10955-like [Quercus robur]|uniref:GDSL esterase/lipase At4g10955-like n=1 Tax=Quercus robur TaxID=38942 RepID=UPI0021618BA8|nr:GDSL esterase/lipase At4g10955-like [Quercus robur]
MPPEKQIFLESGPGHLTAKVDWSDKHYRRSVVASLVKGVYILERNRQKSQKNRQEPQALAPPWWESFHFQLSQTLIDNKDSSIFGAIYEYKYPPSSCSSRNIPHYVIAIRGTLIKRRTWSQDFKLNFQCFFNELHQSSRFQQAVEFLRKTVKSKGESSVWLAGHSLGSAMALLAGKEMAKEGHLIETYLFNPPFFSALLESVIKDERVKFGIHLATSVFKTGLAGLNFVVNGGQADDPFAVLSPWVPYLFVNPDDPICSKYATYFEHRKKMEDNGVEEFEMVATKNSTWNLCLSVLRMDSGSEPLHLLPSADLTINRVQFPDIEGVVDDYKKFKRAHSLQQWWNPFPYESMRYNYNTTNGVECSS